MQSICVLVIEIFFSRIRASPTLWVVPLQESTVNMVGLIIISVGSVSHVVLLLLIVEASQQHCGWCLPAQALQVMGELEPVLTRPVLLAVLRACPQLLSTSTDFVAWHMETLGELFGRTSTLAMIAK